MVSVSLSSYECTWEVPAVRTQEAISCTNSFLDFFSCACKPPMYINMTDTQWP